jgi:hypothetical protein
MSAVSAPPEDGAEPLDAERLDDDDLVSRFEACTLPAASFGHREHVRVAWVYSTRHAADEALCRFSGALRRFAAAQGAAERYHATITWAFMLLVCQRAAHGGELTWNEFAAHNPDLLEWRRGRSVLDRYYRAETLASPLARAVFVMPDKA